MVTLMSELASNKLAEHTVWKCKKHTRQFIRRVKKGKQNLKSDIKKWQHTHPDARILRTVLKSWYQGRVFLLNNTELIINVEEGQRKLFFDEAK